MSAFSSFSSNNQHDYDEEGSNHSNGFYRLIDHTADLGIRVFSKNRVGIFITSAQAMFDLIADRQNVYGEAAFCLSVLGEDDPDLLMNFLRELLYGWAVYRRLVKDIEVSELSKKKLSASITYDVYQSSIHEMRNEIKAVTYHLLSVEKDSDGWQAQVIFDV